MLFRRRNKIPLIDRLRDFVWPRIGWLRTVTYYWRRLQRIPGTPSSIAAGFSSGVAASVTPAVGTHTVAALALAYAVRGNLVASVFGTLAINPWTATPVWFSTYYTGALILGWDKYGHVGAMDFVNMFVGLTEAVVQLDWRLFIEKVMPVFLPMMVGSGPVAIVVGFGSYLVLAPVLRRIQQRRAAKTAQRLEEARREGKDYVWQPR